MSHFKAVRVKFAADIRVDEWMKGAKEVSCTLVTTAKADEIDLDLGQKYQARAGGNDEAYIEAMIRTTQDKMMPIYPLIAFMGPDGRYVLLDGRHRDGMCRKVRHNGRWIYVVKCKGGYDPEAVYQYIAHVANVLLTGKSYSDGERWQHAITALEQGWSQVQVAKDHNFSIDRVKVGWQAHTARAALHARELDTAAVNALTDEKALVFSDIENMTSAAQNVLVKAVVASKVGVEKLETAIDNIMALRRDESVEVARARQWEKKWAKGKSRGPATFAHHFLRDLHALNRTLLRSDASNCNLTGGDFDDLPNIEAVAAQLRYTARVLNDIIRNAPAGLIPSLTASRKQMEGTRTRLATQRLAKKASARSKKSKASSKPRKGTGSNGKAS